MKTSVVILCILAFNLASFTVQLANTGAAFQITTAQAASVQAASSPVEKVDSGKSKVIAILLAIFIGMHQFYLENYGTGIVYILLTFLFGAGAILSLIDCIALATMTDQEFHRSVIAGETFWGLAFLKRFIMGS